MWAALQHSCHVEFYEEFHRNRHYPDEDWQPMVHAVHYLQSQDYAPSLFAFTSLAHFQVTTSPTYAECDHHHFVCITWSFPERKFRLAYSTGGWVTPTEPEQVCDEFLFPSAVDSLIRRLQSQSPESNATGNA